MEDSDSNYVPQRLLEGELSLVDRSSVPAVRRQILGEAMPQLRMLNLHNLKHLAKTQANMTLRNSFTQSLARAIRPENG